MPQKPCILVVDDEESIRNTLRDILEHEDYKVIEATSGAEAIDVMESDEMVDLMLLDIKMEDMNGLEVLDNLNGAGIPVIMISAHANIEIAVEATKKGAVDFIEKPPDLN